MTLSPGKFVQKWIDLPPLGLDGDSGRLPVACVVAVKVGQHGGHEGQRSDGFVGNVFFDGDFVGGGGPDDNAVLVSGLGELVVVLPVGHPVLQVLLALDGAVDRLANVRRLGRFGVAGMDELVADVSLLFRRLSYGLGASDPDGGQLARSRLVCGDFGLIFGVNLDMDMIRNFVLVSIL
jgi:hypothetical protein